VGKIRIPIKLLIVENSISKKLKQLRINAGLSQTQVADRIYLSQSAYQRIESGKTTSFTNHLDDICQLYGIPKKSFFEDETEEHTAQKKPDPIMISSMINLYADLLKEKDRRIHQLESLLDMENNEQLQYKI
jgi:transcriptional regulator with XRE-family HTH domain